MRDELLLMAMVVGLYIYDSILLLYCNEGILSPARNGTWSVRFGLENPAIFGREIFIPNPLLPHRPLFRLAWSFEGLNPNSSGDWTIVKNLLNQLGPIVWAMALALFVLFPLGLFTTLANAMLLTALAVLYVSIFTALLWLWHHRQSLSLSLKQFAGIGFECIVCPPFAINLVRRLSLRVPVNEDLVQASRRLQQTGTWCVTRNILLKRLDETMLGEEENSDQMAAMQARRQELINLAPICP